MAKAQPFLIIEIPVTHSDLDYTLDCLLDYSIYDQFSGDAIDMSGLNVKELREGLRNLPAFREMVKEAVARRGTDAYEDSPYDFMDFDKVFAAPEWQALHRHLENMEEILEDATKDSREFDALERAIEVVKRNGYSVLKAI